MELISNYKKINISLYRKGNTLCLKDIFTYINLKDTNHNLRKFNFKVEMDGKTFYGKGTSGDDAIWLPISNKFGLKVIAENKNYQDLETTLKNIRDIRNLKISLFPHIYFAQISHESKSNERFLVICQEVIKENLLIKLKNKINIFFEILPFVPLKDIFFTTKNLLISPRQSVNIAKAFLKYKIVAEDEWYKTNNFKNRKIVDFHRFYIDPSKYLFKSNSFSASELEKKYSQILKRYLTLSNDTNQIPRWKGSIYQGFIFDNNYSMKGYSSASGLYDSYRKLPFIPLNKSVKANVLDIGSNQGFFSMQASMRGAKNVIGIELNNSDLSTAKDIQEIAEVENVEFINTDIRDYLNATDKKFELIMMNSVLHQIFPNLVNSDSFLLDISSKCRYFAFETPLNHTLMMVSMKSVFKLLQKHFKQVRIQNVYNAYSTGYRVNFICSNL